LCALTIGKKRRRRRRRRKALLWGKRCTLLLQDLPGDPPGRWVRRNQLNSYPQPGTRAGLHELLIACIGVEIDAEHGSFLSLEL
jgi:hypothetical protein